MCYKETKQRTHVHQYSNRTSFNVGHLHNMSGTTSPTIRVGSTHIHKLSGTTSLNNKHTHYYEAVTGPAIPTRPGFHVHSYRGITRRGGRPLHVHSFEGRTAPARDDNY